MIADNPSRFLFLLSSARSGGNTEQLARRAAQSLPCPCDWLDLCTLSLPAFYDPRPALPEPPSGDLALVIDMMRSASDICFVAPVYWYSLPAPAKLLLDHWSGFLDQPGLGFPDWIKTKRLWLVSARADPDPVVPGLSEAMLQRTARWLGMTWGGALHGVADAPGEIVEDAAWQRAAAFFAAPESRTL
ncbi:MAG: flavodoxin family protein [Paracoccaceae bacterium]